MKIIERVNDARTTVNNISSLIYRNVRIYYRKQRNPFRLTEAITRFGPMLSLVSESVL